MTRRRTRPNKPSAKIAPPICRAEQEALAQLSSIRLMVRDLHHANIAKADRARRLIEEDPLSIEVRSGWYPPGSRNSSSPGDAPEEYRILLSWGGPATRIVGNLDEHCQPETARLEHQDWFQPWTQIDAGADGEAALLAYAACFYFGE